MRKPFVAFDQEHASSYDQRWAKLAPIRDCLHLLLRAVLAELPTEARILCVGVGTGSELIYLAQEFPRWQFTAVEPAPAMLAICRERAGASGITSRCTFHEGYLDTLPVSDPFDAATCLLVSQFLLQQEERRDLFQEIAGRLRPQGYLVSADISCDRSTSTYQSLLAAWMRMMKYNEMPDEAIEKIPAIFDDDVAVLPLPEVEALIASGGFETPVLFFQSLLIHAWHSRRQSTK